MVKYKYIGRTHWQHGKTLWEIIGNLKDYGVGRLVTRSTWSHFEEPSFLKIIKSEAFPYTEEEKTAPDMYRKCIVVVEKVFKGLRYPELWEIHSVSYKTDYRLIPKEEEELWYKRVGECKKPIPAPPPTHFPVPPTLKLLLNEEKKVNGQPIEEDMLMPAKIVSNTATNVRLNVLKEIPSKHVLPLVTRPPGGTTLYENIEAFRNAFLKDSK